MNNDDWVIAETAGKIYTDGCHCGAVRFRVTGPIGKILVCHCSECRRIVVMSWGSSWIDKDRVNWLSDDRLACYASSSFAERSYCRNCGSSLFYRMHARDFIGIAPGVFDESDDFQLIGHLFASSHPAWGPCDMTHLPHLDDMWNAQS